MTRAELLEKHGVKRLMSPEKLNEELSLQEAMEFEEMLMAHNKFLDEIEENINKYCIRCNYYNKPDSHEKCDSWIHGASYGVDCKYIGKAKGEDMSRYENRRILDF